MEKDKWVACCLLSLPLCFWLTVCLIESSLKRFYCDVAVLSQSGAENLGRQLSFTSGVQLCSKDWAILTNSSLHPKGGQRAKWFNQYWALCSPPLRAVQPCWASSTPPGLSTPIHFSADPTKLVSAWQLLPATDSVNTVGTSLISLKC